NYYTERLVFKRKPPTLLEWRYPNKIEVDVLRSYAIIAKKARLTDIYTWMSTHSYVILNYITTTFGRDGLTGNIVVEAYESADRPYAMVIFRAATLADESTNRVMQSHGLSKRGPPCPPPLTGLLCRSGTTLHSVWQWLSIHRGRLAYVVNEAPIAGILAIVRPPLPQISPYAAPRSHRSASRDSIDSTLPLYQPPSLQSGSVSRSIREEDEPHAGPPPYWEIAQQTEYGRAHATRAAAAAVAAVFGSPQSPLSRRASQTHGPQIRSSGERGRRTPSASLAGGGLVRTFTQSMPALPLLLSDELAVAAAIEESRRCAVATASASTNEHAVRYVQQSVAGAMDSAERRRRNSGGLLHSLQSQVRMARLSARTNPEYRGRRSAGGSWLWRLFNM
ncbi:hypothetical protein FBU31_006104, partial [Coemansia sp. 'formosensis']